jgi:hypothetical protein
MKSEEELISKLLVSKKIMDRHNSIPRGQSIDTPIINENSNIPEPKYNISEQLLQDKKPVQNVSNQPPTKDRILNSRLPEEIKKLMIEHPIVQPQMTGPSISNELVEKASRLMNVDASGKQMKESVQKNYSQSPTNKDDFKSLIRETMIEILAENGMLTESINKSNEIFTFKVGKHIFEGKVTRIKKVK